MEREEEETDHQVADQDSDNDKLSDKPAKKKKEQKPGIIYLSSVPDYMSVQKLRQTFEEYGEVNRTFFQPVEKSFNFKKGLLFTEGWVEFRSKKAAKFVATAINNSPVGGKKRHPWYNCIWNIKYLSKFTWTDVNADKELKKRVHDSRIRSEIAQAKKQTRFYEENMDRGQTLDKINNKRLSKGQQSSSAQLVHVTQRLTDEEIAAKKKRRRENIEDRLDQKKQKIIEDNDKKHKFVMNNIFGKASS